MLYFGDLGLSEIREWFESSVSIGTTFMVFSISYDFKSDLSMAAFGG